MKTNNNNNNNNKLPNTNKKCKYKYKPAAAGVFVFREPSPSRLPIIRPCQHHYLAPGQIFHLLRIQQSHSRRSNERPDKGKEGGGGGKQKANANTCANTEYPTALHLLPFMVGERQRKNEIHDRQERVVVVVVVVMVCVCVFWGETKCIMRNKMYKKANPW